MQGLSATDSWLQAAHKPTRIQREGTQTLPLNGRGLKVKKNMWMDITAAIFGNHGLTPPGTNLSPTSVQSVPPTIYLVMAYQAQV